MPRGRTFALAASLAVAIAACSKGSAQGSSSASSSGQAPPAPSASGSVSSGIDECDDFLAEYRCFLNEHMPEAEAEAKLDPILASFKSAGASSATRIAAAESCREQRAAQAESFARSGCIKGPVRAVDAASERYPLTAIHAISNDCVSPGVLFGAAPKRDGGTYHWPWVRQAMYANPQFRPTSSAPAAPMQVAFNVYDDGTELTLVGTCKEGQTCNRLAAMYKAVVRSNNPQLFCGKPPLKGTVEPALVVPPDGVWLPTDKADIVARCARIAACMISADAETPGDPGVECQRAPSGFKTDCATRDPCSEVLACVRK
jgi:hypothetical protein